MPKKGKPTKSAAAKTTKTKTPKSAKGKTEPSFYVVSQPSNVRIVDKKPRAAGASAEFRSFAEAKDEALKVLKELHVSSKNYLFNSADRDKLFDGLDPEWQGGLPYTVLIAPGGEVIYRKHDTIEPRELKKIIADHLGRTY